MEDFRQYKIEFDIDEIAEKIEEAFLRYRVRIGITEWYSKTDRVIYKVKLKGNTRQSQLTACVYEVQLRLKLPLFQVVIERLNIFLVVSDHEIVHKHLPDILRMGNRDEQWKSKSLPYVVGHDSIGNVVLVDLKSSPHLLLGGASNSGKSVGLQALLVSIMYTKSPLGVNFILIDVGATNLIPFDGVLHLSCPVVRDRNKACKVLILLKKEMEKRIELQTKDQEKFERLTRLVLVIDEFPALFAETEDKQMIKLMTNAVSSLLQRGRHAKIHVVLAAQNPTLQNMKVDLGNITSRVAFRCAKKNFSETIIGESGAEKLLGSGDMLFKCDQFDKIKRVQGIFISSSELQQMVIAIERKWHRAIYFKQFKFNISEVELDQINAELIDNSLSNLPMKRNSNMNDRLFTEVVLWTLKQEEISCNMIMREFNFGWSRANQFIERLHNLGIVSNLDAKLPRKVLPQSVDDLSPKIVYLLEQNGYDMDHIRSAFKA